MFDFKKVLMQNDWIHGNWGARITMLLPVLGLGLMTLGMAHWGCRKEGCTAAFTSVEDDFDVQKPYPAALNLNRRFLMKKAYLCYQRSLAAEKRAKSPTARYELHSATVNAINDYNLVADLSDPSDFNSVLFPRHLPGSRTGEAPCANTCF